MINCIYCTASFRGRPDKKFCSERCRAQHNYKLRRVVRKNVVKEIDQALKRNRRLLRKVFAEGKVVDKRDLLISRGFEFKYYTTISTNGAKHLFFYCYDIGYSIISDSEILVISGEISRT